MGVFDRLRRLIRANVNDMVRKAEDPEKMLNQLILDMNKQLADAKRSVATAIAEEKRLLRQVETLENQAAEWERRAMVAVRAGQDDLAREALSRKKRDDEYAAQLRQQYERQHDAVEGLKESLRELQDRIQEAQRRKSVLVARAKRAETEKRIREVISGLGDTSAFDAFDEMAQRVDQLESETEAMAELEGPGGSDTSLEQRIAALEGTSADAMLDDLKQRMALPGGESGDEIDRSLEDLKRRLRESQDS